MVPILPLPPPSASQSNVPEEDPKDFMESRFWQWCVSHRPLSLEEEQALGQKALKVLIASVKAGEIVSLDGIETPLSKRIAAQHGVDDFEMNSNWICSAQNWI